MDIAGLQDKLLYMLLLMPVQIANHFWWETKFTDSIQDIRFKDWSVVTEVTRGIKRFQNVIIKSANTSVMRAGYST